jgi:SAM-dependent methyltransferase
MDQEQRTEVESIYAQRFSGIEAQRDRVWQILTRHYFQRWITSTDTVLDLGAGYCEFINNIKAGKKIAVDLNPVTPLKAAADVTVISQDVTATWRVETQSVDVVFTSNFFEHLPTKQDLAHCLSEIHRVLRPNGKLLAMGPNIRFCYEVYWDFFDHYLPLSERSLVEAAGIAGFSPDLVIPRFLPFTMQGKAPPSDTLIRLYLLLPLAWRLLGKQFFVVLRKRGAIG